MAPETITVITVITGVVSMVVINTAVLAFAFGKLSATVKGQGSWIGKVAARLDRHIEHHPRVVAGGSDGE